MNSKKLFIECCKAKDKSNLYYVLKADLGYSSLSISYDKAIISELADIKISELYQMKVGDIIVIGSIRSEA